MSSVALEDIFDAPVENDNVLPSTNFRLSKRPRSSLFLEDSDDEVGMGSPTRRTEQHTKATTTVEEIPDIDAFFDMDDVLDLAPPQDLNAIQERARTQRSKELELTPHAILPSSSPPRDDQDAGAQSKQNEKRGEADKKPRKKIARLDEGRLLGPDGFPALVKQTKGFRPRGKGHELQDLNSLMQIYQFWAHRMYPKTHFQETVKTVEKLCHSRRMHVSLSVWRDESKGLVNGRPVDVEIGSEREEDDDERRSLPRASSPTASLAAEHRSSPSPTNVQPRRASSPSQSSSHSPSRPASASASVDADWDIDAMIAEEEARRGETSVNNDGRKRNTTATVSAAHNEGDDLDDMMWDEIMNGVGEESTSAAPNAAAQSSNNGADGRTVDEDNEDVLAIVREMESAEASHAQADAAPSVPSGAPGSAGPARDVDDDFDDMYVD